MSDKNEPAKREGKKNKGVIASAKFTLEDANRIKEAYENGELDSILEMLGIEKITFGPLPGTKSINKEWAESEKEKKKTDGRDGGVGSP